MCGEKSGVYELKESSLHEAIQVLSEHNINAEPSAAAGLAMFLQMKDDLEIKKDASVVVVSTGNLRL